MKRNKPAVIDISDDETKPTAKKRAEPDPSPEVTEWKQKLAKAEKDRLGAIRIAGEAQARVEFLENLIDKKCESLLDAGDGGDKKLVEELQKKLEEVSNIRDELERKLKLADEREKKLIEEQQKKIEELTKGSEMVRRKVPVTDGSEKPPLEKKVQKKMSARTRKLEAERSQANEDRKRIYEPTCQVACAKQEANNIFELLYTGTPHTTSYDQAVRSLRILETSLELYHGKREWPERRKELHKDESLYCAACKKAFENEKILDHFYSQEHAKKIDAPTAAVAIASVRHSFNKVRRSMGNAAYTQIVQLMKAADAAIDGASSSEDEDDEE